MSLPELIVPHRAGLDYGVGVDAASLAVKSKVVNPITQTVPDAQGVAHQFFDVSRVTSTRELETKLSINVNASYGAPFAGVSARFDFSQDAKVQTSSLFLSLTCTIRLTGVSIEAPQITADAATVVERPDVFTERYGNMFCHSCDRGGLFVGLLQVDTHSDEESEKISASLKGSYGLFSADASVNFSSIEHNYNASVYCSMYSEGGPEFNTQHPDDPAALLDYANQWFKAMHDDPETNAVPYNWTLAPITIASGPLPPNEAEVAHAQDILAFCARERVVCLDQLNLLTHTVDNPSRFNWDGSVPRDTVRAAAAAAQSDLDVLAGCASAAMNHPSAAKMPVDWAPEHATTYPKLIMPDPMPARAAGQDATPPKIPLDPTRTVAVPPWGCEQEVDMGLTWDNGSHTMSASEAGLNVEYIRHYTGPEDAEALTMIPPAGSQVAVGSTVTIVVDEVKEP
jgi:hypothetical protein